MDRRTCPACNAANRREARFCKQCGNRLEQAASSDPLDGLVGMVNVRQELARLCLVMEQVQRDGLIYSDRLHAIVIGNAGTGKTKLVHTLAALYHRFGIVKSPAPIICDAVDFADFSRDFQNNFKKAKGQMLCIENVQKLIPAGYSQQVEQIDRLISEMCKPANKVDPIVVLSGQPRGLREYLHANDAVKSQFPYLFDLSDFTAKELAQLTEAELRRAGFALSDPARDKLARVFKLKLKNSRLPDSEPAPCNAWAALKMAEALKIDHLVQKPGAAPSGRTIEDIQQPVEDEKPIDEVLADLDEFTGMVTLKQSMRQLVNEVTIQRQRALAAGTGDAKPIAFHVVLTGNPGTGKTSVARVLGQTLRAIGVLEIGHVIEADRGRMVGQYQGHTAPLVHALCDRALGGVLFIDEAYTLKQGDGDNFGQEAIDTLLKRMEDDRGKFIVAIAGYPNEIRLLLDSNPGLQSRFVDRYRFHLDDYTPDELLEIFLKAAVKEGYRVDDEAKERARKHFAARCARKDKSFANGREARSLLDACRSLQSQRLMALPKSEPLNADELARLRGVDVPGKDDALPDVQAVLSEIDRMVGLHSVKRELRALVDYVRVERLRAQRGGSQTQLTLHFVFRGNPGTGKTSVARVLGQALRAVGVLESGNVVEADRGKMVGQYQGHTAPLVHALCDQALGGVLFIDEAYALKQGDGDNFGQEAIDTLMKRMDDDRGKFIVIVAGYARDMEDFLASNSGLKGRFTKFIDFEDYAPPELAAIYQALAVRKGMALDESAKQRLEQVLGDLHAQRDRTFANGRTVRNLFESSLQRQAARIAPLLAASEVEADVLETIVAEDIPAGVAP